MSTPEEILAAADALSPSDKWLVVSRLWATIPLDDRQLPEESDLDVLDQRMAEIDAGQVETIPGSEVRRSMHERLNRHG